MNIARKPILMLVVNHGETLDRMRALFQSREPMVDVIGVDTSEKALDLAMHHPIHAVAVDEHLGDMNGLELLQMIRKVRPELTAMIMATPADSKLYRLSRSTEGIQCVDKTSRLDELVTRIAGQLFEEEVGFRGLLENLELPDILQLFCLRGESKQIRIASDRNSGLVLIEKGQVVHARTQSKQGEGAFYDLFAWKGGSFQIQPLTEEYRRTIQKSWESLLLEAGQMLDEGSAAAQEAAQHASHPPAEPASATATTLSLREDLEGPSMLDELPGIVVVGRKSDGADSGVYARKTTAEEPGGKSAAALSVRPTGAPDVPYSHSSALEGSRRRAYARNAEARQGASPFGTRDPSAESKRSWFGARKRPATRPAPALPRRGAPPRPAVRNGRVQRLWTVTAWLFIMVMAIPTFVMLMLAAPWLWARTEMETHLKTILPRDLVPSSMARTTPVAPVIAEPEALPNEWLGASDVCEVKVAPLLEFFQSGNLVAVAAETFDGLGLAQNPWVELLTTRGVRMGVMAMRKEGPRSTIYLRKTMAWALGIDERQPSFVKIRPVELSSEVEGNAKLAFNANRPLAPAYCESWYAAGIGLSVMEEAGLAPGSYALVRGPRGYQSVQIQVMDRGNPDEIWLSERVREAIGVADGGDRVFLYPRSPMTAPAGSASDARAVSLAGN